MFRILCLLAVLTTGCVTGPRNKASEMLPGKIINLSTGLTLPMEYELPQGKGDMTATNPKTGESFEGTYSTITESKVTEYSKKSSWSNEKTEQTNEVSNVSDGSVVLVGDKGTVISFQLKLQQHSSNGTRKGRQSLVGYGDGTDNHGKKYHLQF